MDVGFAYAEEGRVHRGQLQVHRSQWHFLDLELHRRARSRKCHYFQGCVRQEGRGFVNRLDPAAATVALDTDSVSFQLFLVRACNSGAAPTSTTKVLPSVAALTAARIVESVLDHL